MKLLKIVGLLLLVLIAAGAGVLIAAGMGTFGRHEGPGEITALPIPQDVVAARAGAQRAAAAARGADAEGQILFGDLHAPHHVLGRRLLHESARPGRRGGASSRRRLRLRPLLLGPRLLVHQRPRRGPDSPRTSGANTDGRDPAVQRRGRGPPTSIRWALTTQLWLDVVTDLMT